MGLLIFRVVFLVELFAFDVAADKVGVDSRYDFDDPHAPAHGAL
jgi:hypothetical protein